MFHEYISCLDVAMFQLCPVEYLSKLFDCIDDAFDKFRLLNSRNKWL